MNPVGWAYWLNDHWHLCAEEPTAHNERQSVYLAQDVKELEAERNEMQALFDMQWKRMGKATERWRAEDPEARDLVLPDLGDLLEWLMQHADEAKADRDEWKHEAKEWANQASRARSERDRLEIERARCHRALDAIAFKLCDARNALNSDPDLAERCTCTEPPDLPHDEGCPKHGELAERTRRIRADE